MTSLDRCRRAMSIVLVAVCLILVPASAMAVFGATRTPVALSVSTDAMEVLTAVHGSYTCTRGGGNEGVSFAISGFTDIGPAGATYTYTLLRGTTVKATGTSTTHVKTLSGSQVEDTVSTTWTLTIRAKLKNWNGPLYTTSGTCVRFATNTVTF